MKRFYEYDDLIREKEGEYQEKILANSRIATPNPDSYRAFDNEGIPYYQMGTGYCDDIYGNGQQM